MKTQFHNTVENHKGITIINRLAKPGLDVFRRASERCIKLFTFHLFHKKNLAFVGRRNVLG